MAEKPRVIGYGHSDAAAKAAMDDKIQEMKKSGEYKDLKFDAFTRVIKSETNQGYIEFWASKGYKYKGWDQGQGTGR